MPVDVPVDDVSVVPVPDVVPLIPVDVPVDVVHCPLEH